MRLCVYILLIAAHLGFDTVLCSSSTSVEETSPPKSCSQVKLKSVGQCEDEEDCPYQISIPPLTIQLPKQFQLLKKALTELQTMKETVRQLKSACLSCSLQRDTTEMQHRGDGGKTVPANESSSNTIQEMQVKMIKMSNSLKNAHTMIKDLKTQMELSQATMKKVNETIDKSLDNVTEIVHFNTNCLKACPLIQAPSHIIAPKDCSDYSLFKVMKNGVYTVTPDPRNVTFEVFCDMESNGGGWTIIQHRINGSVNFNRSWADYKNGFGDVRGEFWLGNDHIHLLTRAKDMVLRIELEDFQGVREYAKYDSFYVTNEFLKYRLSISTYSGTAGNALITQDNKHNHDQMFFTTWDRDNDKYQSGNCGTYYGSGWWFNACMSANLNGKYYNKSYTGKRDGIYWSTWPNLYREHYLTSNRKALKTIKMMIRPKNYSP